MSSTASRALSGQRTVVSLISAGHCYSHLTSVAVAPLFPALREAFDVSYVALGALMTVFSVATSVAQIPVGLLVDRYGGRLILVIGLVLLGGSFALAGGGRCLLASGSAHGAGRPREQRLSPGRPLHPFAPRGPCLPRAYRQPAQLRRLCRLGHRADVDSRAQRCVRLARRVDRGRHRRACDRGGDPVATDRLRRRARCGGYRPDSARGTLRRPGSADGDDGRTDDPDFPVLRLYLDDDWRHRRVPRDRHDAAL